MSILNIYHIYHISVTSERVQMILLNERRRSLLTLSDFADRHSGLRVRACALRVCARLMKKHIIIYNVECTMHDDSQTVIKRLNRGALSRQTDDLDKSRHISRYHNPNIIHNPHNKIILQPSVSNTRSTYYYTR